MKRGGTVVIVSGLLGAALTACGSVQAGGPEKTSGGVHADPAAAFVRAESVAVAKGSVAAEIDSHQVVGGRAVDVRITGHYDLVRQRATVEQQNPVLGGAVRSVLDGGDVYLQFPAATRSELNLTKPWVAMPVSAVVNAGAADPASGLAALAGAEDVRVVGTEQIGGVPCTHYAMVVDMGKAMQVVSADLRKLLQQTGADLGSKSPTDVWIGSHGLVRKEVAQTKITVNGNVVTGTTTTLLSAFGAPVTVTIPPADQVQKVSSLSALAARAGGGAPPQEPVREAPTPTTGPPSPRATASDWS